jgi:hypothetical protein
VVPDPTVNVTVEEPDPGAAIEEGLKLADAPDGSPVAEREIAELKPPEIVVEMVEVPELPCATERALGEGEIAKSVPGLKMTSRTGWSSIPFGATPV